MGRTGRRPGGSDSRQAILAAARAMFSAVGYDKASVRAIARAAGVDPALVHHFFGSKEALFVAAMSLAIDQDEVAETLAAGDPDSAGERLASFFVRIWEDPASRPPLLGLLRSAVSNERAADALREFLSTTALLPVAGATAADSRASDEARLRATLVASQFVGFALMRYILRVEPLASAEPETAVAWLAPTIQRYLAGPTPETGGPADG